MNTVARSAARAAVAIHHELSSRRVAPEDNSHAAALAWDECRRGRRKLAKAIQHDWYLAAERLRRQLARSLDWCSHEVHLCATQLLARETPSICTPLDIYHDLQALTDEFVDLEIDLGQTTLAATTDDIVLDGLDLGPFRIVLDWSRLDRHTPYEVVAVDPRPAASSETTTHPHVQDNQLCEGDGRSAIRHALRQGRLVDFFLLVRQVLETYNPSSAYVGLEIWQGVTCQACGHLADDDERTCCSRCEDNLCSDCSTSCLGCHETFCSYCLGACGGCQDGFCSDCLSNCSVCDESFCEECLDDDQRCAACREEAAAEDDDECCDDEEPDEAADAPLQPLGLGQAVVSA